MREFQIFRNFPSIVVRVALLCLSLACAFGIGNWKSKFTVNEQYLHLSTSCTIIIIITDHHQQQEHSTLFQHKLTVAMEPVVRDRQTPYRCSGRSVDSLPPPSTWRLLLPQTSDCSSPPPPPAATIWFRNWNTPTNLWHNCCPHKIRPLGVSLPIPSLRPSVPSSVHPSCRTRSCTLCSLSLSSIQLWIYVCYCN